MFQYIKSNLTIAVVVLVLAASAVFVYFNQDLLKKQGGDSLTVEEISEKLNNYFNENFGSQGITASLIEVVDIGDVYRIQLELGGSQYTSYATKDGKLLFPEAYELNEGSVSEPVSMLGSFVASGNEMCEEDGKPIVYFFGSEGCPHCVWEKPVIDQVAGSFEGHVSYHRNIDSDTDSDVFYQYSDGGIPALVLGCKYYRVGSGEIDGEEKEAENLTALICDLTGNQPQDVCEGVQGLINQAE